MTTKEKRELQRLQNRVDELERQREKDFAVYREDLTELVDLRIALKNIHDAMVDSVIEANMVIRPSDRIEPRLKPVSQHTYDNAKDWEKNPLF